jgi:hypothetical protein
MRFIWKISLIVCCLISSGARSPPTNNISGRPTVPYQKLMSYKIQSVFSVYSSKWDACICPSCEDITDVYLKYILVLIPCDNWVPVTTAWRVLMLRMEERPPIWRVAVNVLHKQSRTAEKECPSSLGVGWGANNSSLLKLISLRNIYRQSLGPGLILWYDLSNERGTWNLVLGMLGACIGQVDLQQQPGNWLGIN